MLPKNILLPIVLSILCSSLGLAICPAAVSPSTIHGDHKVTWSLEAGWWTGSDDDVPRGTAPRPVGPIGACIECSHVSSLNRIQLQVYKVKLILVYVRHLQDRVIQNIFLFQLIILHLNNQVYSILLLIAIPIE